MLSSSILACCCGTSAGVWRNLLLSPSASFFFLSNSTWRQKLFSPTLAASLKKPYLTFSNYYCVFGKIGIIFFVVCMYLRYYSDTKVLQESLIYFVTQKQHSAHHVTTLRLYFGPNLKKQNSDVSSNVEDKDDLRVLDLVLKHDFIVFLVSLSLVSQGKAVTHHSGRHGLKFQRQRCYLLLLYSESWVLYSIE